MCSPLEIAALRTVLWNQFQVNTVGVFLKNDFLSFPLFLLSPRYVAPASQTGEKKVLYPEVIHKQNEG